MPSKKRHSWASKILLLGHPPNTQAEVILNPQAGQPAYRNSREYTDLIIDLRAGSASTHCWKECEDETT